MIKMKWSAVVVASLMWMSLGMLVLGGCQNAADDGQGTNNSTGSDTSGDDAPADDAPAGDAPADDAPADDAPADDAPADEDAKEASNVPT